MSTSYINLGSAGSFQPSSAEATIIKSNLFIGTAANLTATFNTGGTKLTLTDPSNPVHTIDIFQTTSSPITYANQLTTARQFLITGDVTSSPILFNGSAQVTFNTIIADNAITTSKVAINSITYSKLSTGAPTWSSTGNLSISNTSSDISFNIGDKRSSNNSSIINFQTQSSPTASITNASISRTSGINGSLVITNSGTGPVILQSGGTYNRVLIDQAGRVGIGTDLSILTYPLHVETGSLQTSPAIYIAPSTAINSKRAEILLGSWRLCQDTNSIPTGSLDFGIRNVSASQDSLYINTTGQVGIGTITLTSGADLTAPVISATTNFVGDIIGTASGNIKKTGSNLVTVDSTSSSLLTIKVGSDPVTSYWPINVAGKALTAGTADVATIANSVADAAINTVAIANTAITASKLNGAQTGTAPIYGARAFGYCSTPPTTSTPSLVGTFKNITSITWISTGKYSVTFTSPMPSTNYAVIANIAISSGVLTPVITSRTVNSFIITTINYIAGVANADSFDFVVFS